MMESLAGPADNGRVEGGKGGGPGRGGVEQIPMSSSPSTLSSISSKKPKSVSNKLRGTLAVNRDTLSLKVILFLFHGAMSSILPYLTIHMRDIGISIKEVAVIYAILPFTTFLGPPLMGLAADRWGRYKPVLILATLGCGFFHTMLLLVPPYRVLVTPGQTFLQFDPITNQAQLLPASLNLCESFMRNHSQTLNFTLDSLTECVKFPAGEGLFNDARGNGKNSTPHFHEYKHVAGSSGEAEAEEEEQEEENGLLELIEEWSGAELRADEGWDAANDELHLARTEGAAPCSIHVSNRYLRSNASTYGRIGHGRQTSANLSTVQCKTNLDFDTGMSQEVGDEATTFWLYFALRILATTFMSCCFTLLDATTLAVVKKSGTAEYGKERIWGILGLAITSPIAGVLVDQISRRQNFTDYSPAFYLSNVLLLANILCYFCMDLEVERPEKGFLKNGYKLLKYPEVVAFLVMIFVMGTMWGFVESYLFIFLKQLDAPNYLLGLTLTVGALTGLPFLWGAEKIVNKVGRVNLLILAFLTYFVRYFGYSYITNPFWCFPFEAMEAVTYHLMWTAAATYCSVLAPKGLLATLMGIMGSLHYSLGKGNGSFIGGYLFGEIGARLTFRWFGVAAGVSGIVFFLIDFFWIRGIVKRRLESKEVGEVEGGAGAKGDQDDVGSNNAKELKAVDAEEVSKLQNGDDFQNAAPNFEAEDPESEAGEVETAMLASHALPPKEPGHNLY